MKLGGRGILSGMSDLSENRFPGKLERYWENEMKKENKLKQVRMSSESEDLVPISKMKKRGSSLVHSTGSLQRIFSCFNLFLLITYYEALTSSACLQIYIKVEGTLPRNPVLRIL